MHYPYQKMKFKLSQDEQENMRAIRMKDVLLRKNLGKMGGKGGLRSELVAK